MGLLLLQMRQMAKSLMIFLKRLAWLELQIIMGNLTRGCELLANVALSSHYNLEQCVLLA